jgi:hypothetical protein
MLKAIHTLGGTARHATDMDSGLRRNGPVGGAAR